MGALEVCGIYFGLGWDFWLAVRAVCITSQI